MVQTILLHEFPTMARSATLYDIYTGDANLASGAVRECFFNILSSEVNNNPHIPELRLIRDNLFQTSERNFETNFSPLYRLQTPSPNYFDRTHLDIHAIISWIRNRRIGPNSPRYSVNIFSRLQPWTHTVHANNENYWGEMRSWFGLIGTSASDDIGRFTYDALRSISNATSNIYIDSLFDQGQHQHLGPIIPSSWVAPTPESEINKENFRYTLSIFLFDHIVPQLAKRVVYILLKIKFLTLVSNVHENDENWGAEWTSHFQVNKSKGLSRYDKVNDTSQWVFRLPHPVYCSFDDDDIVYSSKHRVHNWHLVSERGDLSNNTSFLFDAKTQYPHHLTMSTNKKFNSNRVCIAYSIGQSYCKAVGRNEELLNIRSTFGFDEDTLFRPVQDMFHLHGGIIRVLHRSGELKLLRSFHKNAQSNFLKYLFLSPFELTNPAHTIYNRTTFMNVNDPQYSLLDLHSFHSIRGASQFFFASTGPTIFNVSDSLKLEHDHFQDPTTICFTQLFFGQHYTFCLNTTTFPFFVRLESSNVGGIDFRVVTILSNKNVRAFSPITFSNPIWYVPVLINVASPPTQYYDEFSCAGISGNTILDSFTVIDSFLYSAQLKDGRDGSHNIINEDMIINLGLPENDDSSSDSSHWTCVLSHDNWDKPSHRESLAGFLNLDNHPDAYHLPPTLPSVVTSPMYCTTLVSDPDEVDPPDLIDDPDYITNDQELTTQHVLAESFQLGHDSDSPALLDTDTDSNTFHGLLGGNEDSIEEIGYFINPSPSNSLAAITQEAVFQTNSRIKEAFHPTNNLEQYSFLGPGGNSKLLLHLDNTQYTLIRNKLLSSIKCYSRAHHGNITKPVTRSLLSDLLKSNQFSSTLLYDFFYSRERNDSERLATYTKGRCAAATMYFSNLLTQNIKISRDYIGLQNSRSRKSFTEFVNNQKELMKSKAFTTYFNGIWSSEDANSLGRTDLRQVSTNKWCPLDVFISWVQKRNDLSLNVFHLIDDFSTSQIDWCYLLCSSFSGKQISSFTWDSLSSIHTFKSLAFMNNNHMWSTLEPERSSRSGLSTGQKQLQDSIFEAFSTMIECFADKILDEFLLHRENKKTRRALRHDVIKKTHSQSTQSSYHSSDDNASNSSVEPPYLDEIYPPQWIISLMTSILIFFKD